MWSTRLPLPAKTGLEGPTCRPLRRPLASPLARPLARPLASKPAFLKRFRVGQKLAISAEVSHCSGQLLRAIMSSSVLSRKHGFATCGHAFSVLSTDFWSPCGRGGFFLPFHCSSAVRTSAVRMEAANGQPACMPPAQWTV